MVADNLDIGRPDEVKVVCGRQIRKNTGGEFATKVVTRGTDVTVNAFYKHSRIKQYLKEPIESHPSGAIVDSTIAAALLEVAVYNDDSL